MALTPGPRRRVVLSTAVAESSLTVPGVRAVVDAGLARTPRTDHRRGLAGLVTVRVSAAVAEQRAGRAGREAPGRVYRCWPEGELLARYPEPEIRTADLTRLALDLACWGTPDGSGLRWWDPPPTGPLQAGQQVLRALGALDDGGVTDRGRRLSELGLHPRLARALLDGAALVGARAAAEVVALIDDDTLAEGVAADDELRRLRSGTARGAGRWRVEVTRLRRLLPRRSGAPARSPTPAGPGDGATGLVVALAYPERLARRRPAGTGPQRLHRDVYLMSGGTAVELPAGSPLAGQEWLAVAVADRTPGAEHGRIRLAAAADRELAELAAPALLVEEDEVAWVDGDVVARRVRRLGAIVLTERRLERPDPDAVASALRRGLRTEGLGLLRWSEHARRLRDRLATLHRVFGDSGDPGGPTCPMPPCWPTPTGGGTTGSHAPAAAPTSPGSTPPPSCVRCSTTGTPPGWTSSPRSGSRCRPVLGSPWTTPRTSRCSRSRCRTSSAGPPPRPSPTAGCPSCCTCCPPRAGRPRSPQT